MKSDSQLRTDVMDELGSDPAIDTRNMAVLVKDGVVTVNGLVDTYLQKHAVERALYRVAGVRGVALDLEVRLAPEHRRSDAEIAQAALHALGWHSLVPNDSVRVQVEDGWVTLSGEVDWGYQAGSAEQCVHSLMGVRGITNQIRLKRRADPEKLRGEIAAAFMRHGQREAKHIAVDVDGGVVTLSGTVHSMGEHEAAIGVAYAARGVTRVIDKLQVD